MLQELKMTELLKGLRDKYARYLVNFILRRNLILRVKVKRIKVCFQNLAAYVAN